MLNPPGPPRTKQVAVLPIVANDVATSTPSMVMLQVILNIVATDELLEDELLEDDELESELLDELELELLDELDSILKKWKMRHFGGDFQTLCIFTHYSKSLIFVQKFNFDNFSREIKVVNS